VQSSEKLLIAIIANAILLGLISTAPVVARTAQANSNSAGHAVDRQARVIVAAGDLRARITLARARVFSGQAIGVVVDFEIAPGWHVYGKPLPEEYTGTDVIFDDDLLSGQSLIFPKPRPVKFELLGETLPVYQGRFRAAGNIIVRTTVTPGLHRLSGTLSFQECNNSLCKMPRQLRFEIPLWIDSQRTGNHS
jgi:DsbC/DsbD-like thiol-disulfide interchange protein